MIAPAFTARQCPTCDKWVPADADQEHFDAEHYDDWAAAEQAAGRAPFGFPYFPWNEEPVEMSA